jgi:hypothetical protein
MESAQVHTPKVHSMMTVWQVSIVLAYALFALRFASELTSGAWVVLTAAFLGWLVATVRARRDSGLAHSLTRSEAADLATRSIWNEMATANVFAFLMLLGIHMTR